ncbi:hypothetical protein DAEQUDRAFT_324161 [Daedalea quercina L-15889]|uniref:Uncharacterized protein n=1 Tax=Daedalea quercina L-15889 TaxID=1314783 RepID=A0A165PTH1_9APHY|nr:hypothetical protein DAEQUDRAFT_324161 [Daedalea quercina L-15889]
MARFLSISILLALFAVFTTASNSACHKRGGSTAPLAARACDEVRNLTARTEECDDPCDEDCILGKRDDEPKLRIIHGNASVPWEEGEIARIQVLSARGNDALVFNCKDMPDVCQNMCYGISCARLPDTLTKNTGKRGTPQYKACTAARTKNLLLRGA